MDRDARPHQHQSHNKKTSPSLSASVKEDNKSTLKTSKTPPSSLSFLEQFDSVVTDMDIPKFLKEHASTIRFPEKLLLMLVQAEREAAKDGLDPKMASLTWTRNGKALIVRDDPTRLSNLAGCPTKFVSFTRKLYRWGFRQIPKRNARNPITQRDHARIFHHPLFQRDDKMLTVSMRSVTAEVTNRKARSAKTAEDQVPSDTLDVQSQNPSSQRGALPLLTVGLEQSETERMPQSVSLITNPLEHTRWGQLSELLSSRWNHLRRPVMTNGIMAEFPGGSSLSLAEYFHTRLSLSVSDIDIANLAMAGLVAPRQPRHETLMEATLDTLRANELRSLLFRRANLEVGQVLNDLWQDNARFLG